MAPVIGMTWESVVVRKPTRTVSVHEATGLNCCRTVVSTVMAWPAWGGGSMSRVVLQHKGHTRFSAMVKATLDSAQTRHPVMRTQRIVGAATSEIFTDAWGYSLMPWVGSMSRVVLHRWHTRLSAMVKATLDSSQTRIKLDAA